MLCRSKFVNKPETMSYLVQHKRLDKPGRESIHSGQFMVSQFEAEEQDDEDNLAVPIPEVDAKTVVPIKAYLQGPLDALNSRNQQQPICIEHSLSKLFQCMSIAYRQKLTSPKWNRFRGVRLRWKDKIRLNNVIWRCWHLQFIKKENTLICQFASPLDVDTHNKPEAIVLEGKYWKRKLAAVTAEYKKWRMFYRNHLYGPAHKEDVDMLNGMDAIFGDSNSVNNMMMIDEDYRELISDTLFSTITNQPFPFPDTRELAKFGFADFIQPSLGPLQPNLIDYMDTFDPLQELCATKLPTVPEEHPHPVSWEYTNHHVNPTDLSVQVQVSQVPSTSVPQYQQHTSSLQDNQLQMQENASSYGSHVMLSSNEPYIQTSSYPINPKLNPKSRGKHHGQHLQSSMTSYPTYSGGQTLVADVEHVILNDKLQVPMKSCSSQGQQQRSQDMGETPGSFQEAFRAHASSAPTGYKFGPPGRPSVKFTSPTMQQQQVHAQAPQLQMQPLPMHVSPISYHPNLASVQQKDKEDHRNRPPLRGRGRSRSNTREPPKRPPLISAVSDPALLTPQTNVLLTQLLTTSSPISEAVQAAYNQNQALSTPDLSMHRRIKEEQHLPVLPHSLTSQITVTTVAMTNGDSQSYLSTTNSPLDSPSQNLHSPTSSQGSIGSPGREGSNRDRRVGHIHAEQKRRCNIKNGFDMMHSLIPQLNQNPNAKWFQLAKAAMLQKGAEYIRLLRTERNQLRDEMDSLRQQIESLNTSISVLFCSNCQSMLPATGAPVSRRRDSRMQEMFDEYVSRRTMENWKFWIFSLICRPLLNSFNNFVSSSSLEDLYASTLLWVEQHCTLVDLRPVVLNSLRYLCTKTEILSEPEKLAEEARQLVLQNDKK
ncbi:MLX-interacting protein isoform X1 [Euwallacea similis]|uniref:MLX-interacting protein isoform X1 n=1 Tax=Euwallacea similis TaxID=1736056 RepID=UPI00344BEBB6